MNNTLHRIIRKKHGGGHAVMNTLHRIIRKEHGGWARHGSTVVQVSSKRVTLNPKPSQTELDKWRPLFFFF